MWAFEFIPAIIHHNGQDDASLKRSVFVTSLTLVLLEAGF